MKWYRIQAMLMRYLYLYRRSVPRLMGIFYWPVMELILWGFISVYLEKTKLGGINVLTVLLGAVILWDLLNQSQRTVSIAFLEEVWEKNFLNIFISPLTVSEFLASTVLLGLIQVIIVSTIMSILAFIFYSFNIFTFGFALIPFFFNLLFFGWVLGLFTTGLILRYGGSVQVLAFGFLFLIQPFSAVFYPVSVLPAKLQYISAILPSTYVFEGMRQVVANGTIPLSTLGYAFLLNIVYLAIVIWYFYVMFAYVKKKGLLMKLED